MFKQPKIKGLILDLDGTLIKTDESYISELVKKSAYETGFEVDDSFAQDFWHSPKRDSLLMTHDIPIIPFWENFHKSDNPSLRIKNSEVYQDTYILRELWERGFPISLLTASSREVIEGITKKFKFDFLDFSVSTHSEGLLSKPNPQGVIYCAQKMLLHPREVMMVGNGIEDLCAAHSAGSFYAHIQRPENPRVSPRNLRYLAGKRLYGNGSYDHLDFLLDLGSFMQTQSFVLN